MPTLQAVNTVLLRNAIVLAGMVAVTIYFLLVFRWSLVVLFVLGVLAGLFFLQQFAFSAYVLPTLRETLSETALETVIQVQTAFEIGFAVKVVIVAVELGIEQVFTGDEPLRTLSDGLLSFVSVLVILGILVALPSLFPVSSVVLSVLSAILALRIVQTGVDFAVALASGPAESNSPTGTEPST